MLPKIVSVLDSFISFTRASVATRVNEAGLIKTVPAGQVRMDYDPITLQKKGLLIEEERTNFLPMSNGFTAWIPTSVTVSPSTDSRIFANEGVWLITAKGTSNAKLLRQNIGGNSPNMTASAFLRRDTNNFAQYSFTGDTTNFAKFDLLTGTFGSRSAAVTSTRIPWRDGWYRCTMMYTSTTVTGFNIGIVSSAKSIRQEANTLDTNIYAVGDQIEVGAFATSYISTTTTTSSVTRPCDFTSVTGPDFSSWYSPAEGAFGVEFQTFFYYR
jgi:hypothetical protein